MRIIVKKDYEGMSDAALTVFSEHAARFHTLGFATGNTPALLYDRLSEVFRQGGLSFRRTHALVLDEYFDLSPDNPKSYQYFMRDRLFRHTDILETNMHFPDATVDEKAAVARYRADLGQFGPIDFQIVGIGENGHIGFNEPGSSRDSRIRVVSLVEETIAINNPPATRAITMGIADIMDAGTIMLMASGAKKNNALVSALRGPETPEVPASFLQGHHDLIVVADEAAAKGIMSD